MCNHSPEIDGEYATMITANLIGQWFNQVTTYCVAKILAEKTGQCYMPPADWVDKQGRPVSWLDKPLFLPQPTCGRRVEGPPQVIRTDHYVDLDSFDPSRPIKIEHLYGQNYQMLKPYKVWIKRWLKPTSPFNYFAIHDAVYIHVRRTDYVSTEKNPLQANRQCISTSIEEYAKCLKHFPDAKRLVVVTDDPRDPFLQEFHKLGLPWKVAGGTWDSDWWLLLTCKQMIMSQSTYSWWAGFLGEAVKIVCPMFPNTLWHMGMKDPKSTRFPNLVVDDEPGRWVWVTE